MTRRAARSRQPGAEADRLVALIEAHSVVRPDAGSEDRVCLSKQPYTGPTALRVAEDRRQVSGHATIQAYPCPYCGRWHIGHAPTHRPSAEVAA